VTMQQVQPAGALQALGGSRWLPLRPGAVGLWQSSSSDQVRCLGGEMWCSQQTQMLPVIYMQGRRVCWGH
jgi:hypothetical protein